MATPADPPVSPSVLVLPAFAREDYDAGPDAPDEVERWHSHYDFAVDVELPGLPGTLRFDPRDGVAMARTGIGKAAAASTVGALVASAAVDLGDATVLTVGIAGCPPAAGTVGSVFVADAVVDWDLKQRIGDEIRPLDWRARDYVWELDRALAERAAEAARGVDLANPTSARELRARYGDDREPTVAMGTTVCGDEVWHGAASAGEVEELCDSYGVEGFVTTEMEESGTVTALERAGDRREPAERGAGEADEPAGLLDRYVSVRAVSNFDRAPDGGDPRESVAWLDFETGVENAFRAGRSVVEAFAGGR